MISYNSLGNLSSATKTFVEGQRARATFAQNRSYERDV